jgi:hypothetical protein
VDCPSEPIELKETLLRIAIIISGYLLSLGTKLTEKTPVIGSYLLLDQPFAVSSYHLSIRSFMIVLPLKKRFRFQLVYRPGFFILTEYSEVRAAMKSVRESWPPNEI